MEEVIGLKLKVERELNFGDILLSLANVQYSYITKKKSRTFEQSKVRDDNSIYFFALR